MFGCLTGCWISSATPLVSSLVGVDNLPPTIRLRNLLHGLSGLAAPHLVGLVDNRQMVAYIVGGTMAGAVLVYAAALWDRRRRKHGYLEIT